MSIALQILKANGEIANPAARLSNAQATVIKAESGQRFQLIDEITGFAPENIEVQRAGNDLLVAFEGQTTEQPGLIIQDYYATAGNKTDNLLVGLHENGAIYPYVPETAQAGAAIHQLAEGVVATQAVGGSVATAAAMALPLWPLALIPLAGLAALAGGGGGGGGGDDKPALPKASISGLEKVNEGIGTVEYTVTLDKPAAEDVTIKYTITPNAPTSVEDFTKDTPMTGTVTIPKGKTTATIPVGIENDHIYEGEESYTVKISDPTNATIGKDSITTTIYDNGTTDGKTPGTDPVPSDPKIPHDSDDDRPTVSIEGPKNVNEGIGQAKYTIKLDKASGVDTEITYTVAHAADDPKTDDKDFGTNGAGTRTVIIKAGQTSAEISVDIENDKKYESANGGEKYTVSIDKAVGGQTDNTDKFTAIDNGETKYGNKSVTTAIWDNGTTDGTTPGNNPPADPKNPDATPHNTDDDRDLTLGISGPTAVNEAVGKVTYTVTLNKVNNTADTTVDVILKHGTTDAKDFSSKIADGDIVKKVTIPKGSTTLKVDFDLGIHNDDIFEGKEDYTVTLVNPKNAAIDKNKGSVTTVIWDDGTTNGTDPADPKNPDNPSNVYDDRPTVSIEGLNSVNEGIGQAKYTIKLDKASGVDTEITYTVAHAADDPKTDDKDFGTNGAGTRTVIIKAGQTSAKISVDIENDKEYESANGGEKYTVSIDKAEGVKTENGETIKKELKYGNKSVTTEIWDDGTTDGKTPGNNPPADPKNPDATPHDTDDDRPLSITGDGDEVEEGKEYAGTFTIGPKTSFTSITINGKELGLNKIINASNEFPIDLDPNSDKDGAIRLKITGYNPETGELSYTYKSNAQDHSKNDPIINEIPFTLLGTDGNKHDGKFTVKITDTAPEAVDDENKANIESASGSVLEKTASGNVLDNDKTGEDTPTTVIGAQSGVHDKVSNGVGTEIQGELGTLKIQADGSYTYTPNQGKTGKDVFTYTIKDADGTISTAKLTITVNSPADISTTSSNQIINLINSSISSVVDSSVSVTITDKDTNEHYLKAIGETEKLSNGNIISGAYGNFKTVQEQKLGENDNFYKFEYKLDTENTVIKALSKGLDLTIYDNLNIHSYDGMTANSYAALYVAINGNVNPVTFKNQITKHDDIYQEADVSNATINTLAGNDVVVINSAKKATISLGEGDDYFYAKDNISNTSIQGGDGDDVITLYGTATNGSKINGGSGKDTLVLAQDTTIDGNQLSITNIEIIDLRSGNGKDANMAPNTVTLTQSALVDNGVKNISLFANKTDASNKNPLDVFTLDVDDESSVSRDGNVYTVNLGAQGTYTITDELNIGINIV
ncbi:Calx-beta domain-containing protein [Suttonella indologenes]|uniref:Sodium/calcium exchanger 1 n=1 Tax=Suttonella indologenes TaxID=13276 RepID=A0A380MVW8_9GAMM|nr:Calx-beta domain-containing protein [Suttonella indologenes]SUO96705.1 sodium/calcium exchanger 1 [Suttonella indologenes]